jgi:hypothetical protein
VARLLLSVHQKYTMIKKLLFTLFLLFSIVSNAQNTLDRAKNSVNSKKSESQSSTSTKSSTSTSKRSSYSSEDSDNYVNPFESMFTDLVIGLTYGLIKTTLVESRYEGKHLTASITKYPYFENKKGDFNYEIDDNYKPSRLLLSNEYIKTNQNIIGNYFKTDLQFGNRFGLVGDFLYFSENNYLHPKTNYLHYTLLVNYYRVRTEKFSLWYGIGTRYAGSGINKFGFAYAVGTRYFVAKPFSLEMSFKGSRINQSNVNHFNSHLKYHHKNKFFSLGYSAFKIGTEDFGGITVGLGIYL